MPTFVHLTPAKHIRSIRRAGIAAGPTPRDLPDGVYAMPVIPHFYRTHQWLRELKRSGQRTIYGVYFRIPDATGVWVGRYNEPHRQVTAAEAAAILMDPGTPDGYEVIVPGGIAAHQIRKIRILPQGVGWRYYPSAHGHRPCGCLGCLRPGEINSQRIRRRYDAAFDERTSS
jgi:hypothetical protein